MASLSITTNAKRVAAKIAGLEGKIREETRRKARAFLRRRISSLKKELDFLVNQAQRVPDTREGLTAQPLAQKIAEEQAFGKSRAVNHGDDFHTDMTSPTYKAALVNGGNNYAMRVRDSSIHPDASYEDYRDSFSSTLSDKVFAIQDAASGSYRYFIIPPGSPLLDEVLEGVKIFCSSFTDLAGAGRPDGDPLKDIGVTKGQNKFERDKNKGFTEFTLKEGAIRAIQERGKDVTGIVLNTQHGEYEDAFSISRHENSPAMQRAAGRASEAMEGRGITPEAESVANTNKAISNIKIKENSSANSISFTVQTSINNSKFISDEVLHAVKREVLIWSSESEGPFKTSIEQALDNALKDFKKGA